MSAQQQTSAPSVLCRVKGCERPAVHQVVSGAWPRLQVSYVCQEHWLASQVRVDVHVRRLRGASVINPERAVLVLVRYVAAIVCAMLLNWGVVIHPLHPLAAAGLGLGVLLVARGAIADADWIMGHD